MVSSPGPISGLHYGAETMMRRTYWLGAVGILFLAACATGEAVVTAEVEVEDPDQGTTVMRAISDLEVRLVPFDRDAVFDSLADAAERPEPEIPDSVMQAQTAVRDAQILWQNLELRWNGLRDNLQTLSEQLDGMSRSQGQYRVLFRDFQDAEAEYDRIERQKVGAFEAFTTLQASSLAAAEENRMLREQWADEAFAEVGLVLAAKHVEAGNGTLTDTTDAQGVVVFTAPPGSWWVSARYRGPFSEFYWNIPVTLPKGEPIQVQLTTDKAEERPIF